MAGSAVSLLFGGLIAVSAACNSDLDCSLNGDCNTATGKCDCDAAWYEPNDDLSARCVGVRSA